MAHQAQITFYTRPGCHLCEEAYSAVSALADRFGFTLQIVDIMGDAEAHRQWWAEIPVVIVGDEVIKAPIDHSRLRRAFAAYARHRP